jgi:hypothetical protein
LKLFRKILLVSLILLCLCAIFRSSLYRSFFSYRNTGKRIEYPDSKELSTHIEGQIKNERPSTIREIIVLALKISSGCLCFTSSRPHEVNPNLLPAGSYTHCIGYSAYFNTVCNYLLKKYGYANWTSEHCIAQIHFAGLNIHQFFSSAFFADHDYNIILNSRTGETFSVDPSLHDYTGIEFVN